jgi:hypothetical protein
MELSCVHPQEAPLSDVEPIAFRRPRGDIVSSGAGGKISVSAAALARFDRRELNDILNLYGRMVASGEWRDYAIDFTKEKAVFSVYRRSSEYPLYRIEKTPKNARKQGAYAVIATTGLVLRRGHDLKRVISVLEPKPRLID